MVEVKNFSTSLTADGMGTLGESKTTILKTPPTSTLLTHAVARFTKDSYSSQNDFGISGEQFPQAHDSWTG